MENNLINAAFYRGKKTFSVEQVKLKKLGPDEVAVKLHMLEYVELTCMYILVTWIKELGLKEL